MPSVSRNKLHQNIRRPTPWGNYSSQVSNLILWQKDHVKDGYFEGPFERSFGSTPENLQIIIVGRLLIFNHWLHWHFEKSLPFITIFLCVIFYRLWKYTYFYDNSNSIWTHGLGVDSQKIFSATHFIQIKATISLTLSRT